jgi:hypothetical protein
MEYLRFSLIFSTIFSVPVFFLAKIGPHIECTCSLWSCVLCAVSCVRVCVVRYVVRVVSSVVCSHQPLCVGDRQLCLRCMPAICISSACS